MSIIKAYGADCCGRILPEQQIVGIVPVEDLFDTVKSFPTDMRQERCQCHYCLDCYRDMVLVPTENNAPRKNGQEQYHHLLRENAYIFRKRVVKNWHEKKYFLKKLHSP